MPTLLSRSPYRFYVFSNESFKSPGITVDRGKVSARFFLESVKLDENFGFCPEELDKLKTLIREYQPLFLNRWESSLKKKPDVRVKNVAVTDQALRFHLEDGRTISVPLAWYPKLYYANDKQRSHWKISLGGFGVHWPYLDEDICSEGLLRGQPAPKTYRE